MKRHIPHEQFPQGSGESIDPVCGMDVKPLSAAGSIDFDGKTYFFCSAGCLEKFRSAPRNYVKEPSVGMSSVPVAKQASVVAEWTCPMHPEIVRNAPGNCPICGMALEPR